VALPPPAVSHFAVGHYWFKSDDCSMPSNDRAPGDAVNFVGYGYGSNGTGFNYGNGKDTLKQIHGHNTAWSQGGRQKWWRIHGSSPNICEKGLFSMATGWVVSSRKHLRMIPTYHPTSAYCGFCVGGELNFTTLGAAHRDTLVNCWTRVKHTGIWVYGPRHSVQPGDFDNGRRDVTEPMRTAGHAVHLVNWGNTRLAKQCNGVLSGSNGYVAFFKVNAPHHGSWPD
jgi:hypothetical protein